jgi:hypothetical protein
MPTVEENYELIRRHDERFAFELAKQIIDKPKASVWIIFMPVLFVFYAQRLQKYKGSIHGFVKHYLHTKALALDAALEESRGGAPLEEGGETDSGFPPSQDQSQMIREKQYQELDLLKQHYFLMLKSPGNSYPELLRKAYGTSGAYRIFLNRLTKAEKEVNKAVLKSHHPTPEAQDVVERIERYSDQLREMEIEKIFS